MGSRIISQSDQSVTCIYLRQDINALATKICNYTEAATFSCSVERFS